MGILYIVALFWLRIHNDLITAITTAHHIGNVSLRAPRVPIACLMRPQNDKPTLCKYTSERWKKKNDCMYTNNGLIISRNCTN